MEKEVKCVPKGIRYISEWAEYSLKNFNYPHILNKQITGCGFTEYCLTSDIPVVICSPRRALLENKTQQHANDPGIFYVRNELDSIASFDKDISNVEGKYVPIIPEKTIEQKEEIAKRIQQMHKDIEDHFIKAFNYGVPCKYLVTYDSFRHVKEVLQKMEVLDKFYIVIDEFQSIFTDSRFKSDTELTFVDLLQGINKVCFVSATPMIDKYLEMLDEFKSLPYFELDWKTLDPGRVLKPQLDVRSCKSVISEASRIVQSYLSGNFEKCLYRDDNGNIQEIESREAVIYVNSVKNICEIIRRNGLTPDNTNVLCSTSTKSNIDNVRKAFGVTKRSGIDVTGRIPGRGEPHKMFTLCTRTVYLGADFYSTNARSFILSDANVDSLAVDISLDLPQILGRQRLIENPWKNRAEFYYKVSHTARSQESFNETMRKKVERTRDLLNAYEQVDDKVKHALAENYQYVARAASYRDNFVAVNTHSGNDLKPVFNTLVAISEKRAFEIQQLDYKDRFSVFATVNDRGYSIIETGVTQFLQQFDSVPYFTDKMRLLCECGLCREDIMNILDQIPLVYKNYYLVLGPERIKALYYQNSKCEEAYKILVSNQGINIKDSILSMFQVGQRYKRTDIKQALSELYTSTGYNKVAKASDLEEYFDIKPCKLVDKVTNKKDHGFEIISLK